MSVYIVGSQVGYLCNVDDCIINGVFLNIEQTMECISRLRQKNPGDAYAVARVPMNKDLALSFSAEDAWIWIPSIKSGEGASSSENASSDGMVDLRAWCVDDGRRKSAEF